MSDQWCEQKVWLDWGLDTNGIELFAASTGIVMCLIPFLYPNYKMSIWLYLLQMNIVLLGIGTFVFHWWPPEDEYGNKYIVPFDWFPMIFTLANLLFIANSLYFYQYTVFYQCFSVLAILVWIFALIYLMHEMDINWLQTLLIAPPVLVLLVVSAFIDLYEDWIYLFISLGLWLVNRFACSYWSVLGQLHGIWHIVVGYALWDIGKVLTNV
jgi:hypothetical protein